MRVQTRFIILSLMLLSLSMSAMALTIELYPLHVQNSAGDNVSITVRVADNSTPLNNVLVNFITDLGYLNSASTLTNATGYGRVFLTSTGSGIATLNASAGNISTTTNITFSPLSPQSIIITESSNPVTAGNTTTVTIGMLDQFGNVNDTATLTLNITLEDVFGNVIHETGIMRTSHTLTHIEANSTDIVLGNSVTDDENITLEINSTIAGNINIFASCGGVSSSKDIEVQPAAPFWLFPLFDPECTVNTTSSIFVYVYDMYNNPIRDAIVLFNATPPESTQYNSPNEYNSLSFSNTQFITGIDGRAFTVFRTDKRAGENAIYLTVANSSVTREITITGLADDIDTLLLTHSPPFTYANNKDIYSLTGQAVDRFLNPIIPAGISIKEQVVFYSGKSHVIVPLDNTGKASVQVGPTPYIQNVSINAIYKNASGHTNITNSTILKFIAGSNISVEVYVSPDTLLARGLNGNHESTVKAVALDEWGHHLPGVNLTMSTTNATVGNLSMNGINATTIYGTTNDFGKLILEFMCSNISGNTTIVATAANSTASKIITVKDVPFLSVDTDIEYIPPVMSGSVVNVTTVVSIEGDLPIIRPTASAMLVLDRSGSMDPDYYAGTPLDVALVIDRSGSMEFLGSSPEQPLTDAKTAAKQFINNLASNAQVGVVSFSSSSRMDIDMNLLNSHDNKTSVKAAITVLNAGGSTAMGDGMADANRMLINGRTDSKKVMIVLTDGVCNAGSDRNGQTAIATAKANGITIYTIGLGTAQYIDEPLLQNIAYKTGGLYYNAPTSSELNDVYNSIAQEISDYDIDSAEYGTEGFTPYDHTFSGSLARGSSFETTFAINETINDLKVELDWVNSSVDMDLNLISPSKKVYGKNNDTTGYYFDSREEVPIDVRSPEFDTYVTSLEPTTTKSSGTSLYVANSSSARSSVLFRWKLPDAPTRNAQIESVTMYLYGVSNANNASSSRNISVYDVSTNYNNPTWSYNASSYTWKSGNFSISDYNRSYTVYSRSLTSNVVNKATAFDITDAKWGFDRLPEWGESCDIVLIGSGSGYNDGKSDLFLSSEMNPSSYQGSLNGRRPLVTVTYSVARDTSEYIWLHPLSNLYPDDDMDIVETGNWTARVTSSGSVPEPFTISTHIDKKSASRLSSHAFISSLDESRGDKAGLALYSFEDGVLTNSQTSYVHKHSTWTGYFTAQTTRIYNFNLSWDDACNIGVDLYDGTDVLDSATGTGTCEVSSLLFAGNTYHLDVTKRDTSTDEAHFIVNVTDLPLNPISAYYDSQTTPKFRTWDDPQWSLENPAKNVFASPYFLVLEPNPLQPEVLMVTGDSSRDVNTQIWNGESWDFIGEICNNLTSSTRKAFDMKYEQLSGDAVIVYANASKNVSVPRYQVWNGSSWGSDMAVNSTNTGAVYVGWVRLEANPRSDEMILTTLDNENYISAQVWNGYSWQNPVPITTSAKTSNYQCFDVAYEQSTGHAMVVWADSSYIKYRIWNGDSWGIPQNLVVSPNTVCWMKLAADPHSNNMILVSLDTANDVEAYTWDGSSWSYKKQLETNTGMSTRRAVDVAFEQSSGTGLVVWGDNTAVPKYNTWDGSSWGAASGVKFSASNIGGTTLWVQLTPDPFSDEIFLMTSDSTSDLNIQKWSGSSWSSATEVETSSSSSYECFDIAYNVQEVSAEDTLLSWSQWTGQVTSSLNNDSLSHLSNSIDTITSDGLTAIDEGLFVANNELVSVDGNSTIVLMTDGLDNAGHHSLFQEAYRAKQHNTVIYTVGFGNNESEVDPVLSEIASITGGEYYFAPNSSVLKDIFKGIAAQITNFSAQGPELNIYIPHNYSNGNSWANVVYKNNTSNCTIGNLSTFITPKYPGLGNAEPMITHESHNSILKWQLPTLSSGDKWGIWYQMVVEGSGSVPLIMPESYITYADLNGTTVNVDVPDADPSFIGGGSTSMKPYPPGSLILTPEKSLLLINEPTKLTLYLKNTVGKPIVADVVLDTNLGLFDDYGTNHIVIHNVSNGEVLNFSTAISGNAYIKAYVYDNSSIKDDELLVVRPKGMIRIK